MESDYLCVRNHVYDFLLTLSVHLQLVDPQETYPGCTAALQGELLWMLLHVLRRQAVLKSQDEMIWTAAAKCVLVIMPREYRHLVDGRALLRFLKIEKLAELHADIFGVLAEAFAHSLMEDKRIGVLPHENLHLDREALAALGGGALTEVLTLYRKATTVGGRLAFFHVLFAFAAHRVGVPHGGGGDPGAGGSPIASPVLQRCFQLLVSLEFFWYVHPLLFYQSHRVLRELAAQIHYDVGAGELPETRALIVTVVQEILRIIDEDASIPDVAMRRFWELKQNSQASIDALVTLSNDVIAAVPLLLKESAAIPRMYNLAWRLSFYLLRTMREHLAPALYEPASRRMLMNIVSYEGTNNESVLRRIRGVYSDLVYAAGLLGRTQPEQGVDIAQKLIESYFFIRWNSNTNTVAQLMALYHQAVEFMACRTGTICGAPAVADITELLFTDRLYVTHSAVQGFGLSVLWGLYRGLTADHTLAVCRARHVLVSLIARLSEGSSESSIRGWKTVMADPYPQAGLVGAECIVAIYRKQYGDRVEPFIKRTHLYKAALKLIENHDKFAKPKKK
ncbi:hypothetical protein STCU_09575 [Strigomonas culicis]|uniref:Uncharacterized protein n=1 Tax=Strigomonas culicis TaxID=28005 RepID=S9UXG1_9TRYP|nr:hypothetical protein STCU_09575 [Strigomonas culicis]|eukprot:EPY19206.1 hypothetical protein STCU_09575 [Strigomonas culicis]